MGEITEACLLNAIKNALELDGTLDKLKEEIQSAMTSIFNATNLDSPEVPEETKLINELIREYLNWNGYLYTEQIFVAESGQSNEKTEREVLAEKVNVIDNEKTVKLPLLYYIVAAFQNSDDQDDDDSDEE